MTGHAADRAERGIPLPFPERDLMGILTRQHLVASFQYETSMPVGALIGQVEFPGAFTQFSNIMNKLSNFAYARFDVEVEIRPVGSAVTAGLVTASWLPFNYQDWNYLQTAYCNPVHIDMGAPASTLIHIPFVHWNYAITLPFVASGTGSGASMHSLLQLHVEHPLRVMTTTTTPMVILQVFARMKNVQLGGDIVSEINEMPAIRPVEDYSKEEILKILANLEKASQSSSSFKKQPAQAQADIADYMKGKVGEVLGEGQSSSSTLVGTIMGGVVDAITGVLGTRPPDTRSARPIATLNNYHLGGASAANYLQPIMNHKDYLVESIHFSRFGDHRAFDTINDLATLPGLITQFTITPSTPSGTIFKTIAVTPNWTDLFNPVSSPPDEFSVCYPTPSAHVADHFLGWRGSNKYLFRFTGSQLAPCVIGWTFYPYASAIPDPATILRNQGDTVSGVINVVGSTTYKLEIPYMSPGPMVYCKRNPQDADQDTFNTGYLALYLITPVAAQDAGGNANIVCSVWHSVGDDMQWFYPMTRPRLYNQPGNQWFPVQSAASVATNLNPPPLFIVPAETQSLVEDFKDKFMLPDKVYSVGSKDNASESAVTFRDVIFRPRPAGVAGNQSVVQLDVYRSAPTNGANEDFSSLVPRLMRCFRFWRGSRTIGGATVSPFAVRLNGPCFTDTTQIYLSYGVPNYLTTWTDFGITIPWLCLGGDFTGSTNNYTPYDYVVPAYFVSGALSSAANDMFRGFGDDFQFGGLVPPVPFYVKTN